MDGGWKFWRPVAVPKGFGWFMGESLDHGWRSPIGPG
jgi:hypothetical protein